MNEHVHVFALMGNENEANKPSARIYAFDLFYGLVHGLNRRPFLYLSMDLS
ncbi:hypothetical protein DPMN_088146 [Dreissena polymorpha]|uniref:Uncharacterized protein n=1 Tax=Dreissena polymorpha TaxID=45954 RepID=A0A9D4KU01_DREPO|nr:hypothetical protein DPMN_088146 [Dreissena polymorpha]